MKYERLEAQVRERIARLRNEKGFSENGLADGDSPTQRKLNRQLSRGAAITLDTLLLILEKYPDVSAEWLLRGEGDMMIGSGNTSSNVAANVSGNNIAVGSVSEGLVSQMLAEKDRQIQTLMEILKER